MEIKAQIVEGIRYKPHLKCSLPEIQFADFNINSAKSSCLIADGENRLAFSKWVSPKRTRSYPYERVYNTFSISKRITVIPVLKDEGAAGDRDFLQWDTISLMSLLDVYVVLAYYKTAEKHRTRTNKITNQKFDNDFVQNKIKEISNYYSSALHWNLKELKTISQILESAKTAYREIEEKTKVKFHGESGLETFSKAVSSNLSAFMDSSRLKAQLAQGREFLTVQPKEILATQTKAKITITNFLGGKYFFTVDEIVLREGNLFLIEAKHSKSGKLPSVGDIKDGLLKMMLYTNLENVSIESEIFVKIPVLRLTSGNIIGDVSSQSEIIEQEIFFRQNSFNRRQKEFIQELFIEAKENNFLVSLEKVKMIRSPLRYPGGKSRALEKIAALIPAFDEFREPFVGGGSIFIYLKQQFPLKNFWINDKYTELATFWHGLQTNSDQVIRQVRQWKNEFSDGKTLHKFLRENINAFDEIKVAAAFFVFNRITFSGTTEAGGFSEQAVKIYRIVENYRISTWRC